MFRDVEADFYFLVDGDGTYDAGHSTGHAAPGDDRAPGSGQLRARHRSADSTGQEAYRPGHQFGNRLLTAMVTLIFGNRLTRHALRLQIAIAPFREVLPGACPEVSISRRSWGCTRWNFRCPIGHLTGGYKGRPEGSTSKLNTYRDGLRIVWLIAVLVKHERPLQLFGLVAALLLFLALLLGAPVVTHYLATGLVPRLPTAVLATGLILVAVLSSATGLILDTVTRGRREGRMLAYLQYDFRDFGEL